MKDYKSPMCEILVLRATDVVTLSVSLWGLGDTWNVSKWISDQNIPDMQE